MKQCFKCLVIQPIDEFYKHPEMRDGHLNKCKSCTKADVKTGKVPRVCTVCYANFLAHASEIKRRGGGAYTCSRACYYKRLQGLLDEKYAVKTGYHAKHKWVQKHLGRPSVCEHCRSTTAKRYEWSNISGEYKQELSDWQRLCKQCHHAYDRISQKTWHKRRTGKHSTANVASGVLI